MTELSKVESSAHLRHEYRTPVKHIVGYTELLIEEAGERHLEPLLPVLQRIYHGGRELLESIDNAFSEHADPNDAGGRAFQEDLHASVLEISRSLTSLVEDLERGQRQTLADLDAISWAIHHLLEMGGQERGTLDERDSNPTHRGRDLSCDAGRISRKRGTGRILVADDDAASRILLRRRLECEGHQVVEVRNGAEALDSLMASPCDLVLLDIVMPVMDGFQTLARIKQDARLGELPVIMISALDEMRNVVRCIETGAEDFLPKPFNRIMLQARIGACLERKWLRDRERRKTGELEQTLRLLEQAHEQLALQASRDALTGLANRRSVETHLDFLVKRGTPFTAIHIGLKGFKKVNDAYGSAAGDDLLKQVGKRLPRAFGLTDVIGRWAGDEFLALVDVGFPGSQINLSRSEECFAEDFIIGKGETQHRVNIGAAMGAATWKPGDTATELLHCADSAMVHAKLRS